MEIPGKGLTTSLDLRTKNSNKKQKSRSAITDINNKDFSKLLKKFKNSPYIGWKSKQVYNKPNEAYFFLIKHITNIMKNKRWVQPKILKLGVNKAIRKFNETIGHVNETIGHLKKVIQFEELESNNKTTMCKDKDKQISSAYDTKG